MKTLTLKTGMYCESRNHEFKSGEIIEHLTFHYKHVGELIVGGRNATEKWIESEFYCKDCGQVFRPTKNNKLVYSDKEKVLKIMATGYFKFKFKRKLFYPEILPVEKKDYEYLDSLSVDSAPGFSVNRKTIEFERSDDFNYKDYLHMPKGEVEEIFLISVRGEFPVLLNKTNEERTKREIKVKSFMEKANKLMKEGKEKEALSFVKKNIPGSVFHPTLKGFSYPPILFKVKIGKVVIPKNAVPATLVKVFDKDLNTYDYWVPTDSLIFLKE